MSPVPLCFSDLLAMFPEVWLHILMIDLGRYFAFAIPAALMAWVLSKPLSRRRIQRRLAVMKDRLREVRLSLLTSLVFSLNGFFLVYGLDQLGVIDIHRNSALQWIMLESLLIILAHDAYFYWLHRAMHWRPLFRLAHMAHHRSRTPTAWAAYAFAPAEAMLEALFLPLFLLGMNIDGLTILVFLMHMMARNVIGHCGFEIMPRWWITSPLTRWMTTPTHHDIHHELVRWNYGLYFTWWDRWMGTEHPDYHARFLAAAGGRQPMQINGLRKEA